MTETQASDADLIARSRSGDHRAFGELVRRYESAVAGTVIGMLGATAEARDVGQRVFIRFFNSMGQFRGDASLRTYLTRIAINLCLNELKRRKRDESRFAPLENADLPTSDRPLEAAERQRLVRRAIGRLDPPFRSVVVLRLIEGYSVKETASLLDIPVGTVLSRLSRAQKKLKELLAPYLTEDG